MSPIVEDGTGLAKVEALTRVEFVDACLMRGQCGMGRIATNCRYPRMQDAQGR